jgi:hypothetical protein
LESAKKELLNELVTAMGELLAGAQRSGWVRHDVSIDDVTMLMAGLSHTSLAASDQPARSRCVNLVCDALRGDKSTARAAGRAHPRSL